MNVNQNWDSSFFLLNNSSQNYNSQGSGLNLADYASIKNGSYRKALNAYFEKNPENKSMNPFSSAADKESLKNLSTIKADAAELKDSAEALMDKSTKSLFKKKDITTTDKDGNKTTKSDYDMDAICKGIKAFTDDYNSLLDSTLETGSTKVLRQAASMVKFTKANSTLLKSVGITIGADNKLNIDEEKLKKASITSLKSLFNDTSSYAYTISTKASTINKYAAAEASKSTAYNSRASYDNFSSGNLFNSYL